MGGAGTKRRVGVSVDAPDRGAALPMDAPGVAAASASAAPRHHDWRAAGARPVSWSAAAPPPAAALVRRWVEPWKFSGTCAAYYMPVV